MALVESFSGIRGLYPMDIDGDIVRRYVYVFHQFLEENLKREPLVVVGCDTRESSSTLKEAAFDSLFNIIDVGIITIPALQFAVRHLKADGGIMITASHNEPEYNGLKFLDRDGAVLREDGAEQIITRYHNIAKLGEEDFLNNWLYKKKGPRIKKISNIDIRQAYFRFITGIVGKQNLDTIGESGLKIVLDPVGGPAAMAEELLKSLGVEVIGVNTQPGEFKRVIDPNDGSLSYLKETILEEKADFAAGFDLDGDRMAIILEDGTNVSGNYILALLVDDVLSEKPKNMIVVTNDATSNVVKSVAEKRGAKVKEVEVGEINVVDEIYKLKSPIGGEGSCAGAIYPPSRCRDGILSLLFILKIVAKTGKKIKKLVEELPLYFTIQRKISIDPKKHDLIKRKIKKHYSRHKIQETGDIAGGLKVMIDDGFVWFRASKTEAGILRIIADSKSQEKSKKLMHDALDFVRQLI